MINSIFTGVCVRLKGFPSRTLLQSLPLLLLLLIQPTPTASTVPSSHDIRPRRQTSESVLKAAPNFTNSLGQPLTIFSVPSLESWRVYQGDAVSYDIFADFIASLALTLIRDGENVVVLSANDGKGVPGSGASPASSGSDKMSTNYDTTSRTTRRLVEKGLPSDAILASNLSAAYVALLRDVAPVRAIRPVRFRYKPLHLPEYAAKNASAEIDALFSSYHLPIEHYSGLILDGGNIADNGIDKAIVTDRVIYDNRARYNLDQINLMLTDALGYKATGVISEVQADHQGHASDMCAFIDRNTVLLGHLGQSEKFTESRAKLEIRNAFKNAGIQIVDVPKTNSQTDKLLKEIKTDADSNISLKKQTGNHLKTSTVHNPPNSSKGEIELAAQLFKIKQSGEQVSQAAKKKQSTKHHRSPRISHQFGSSSDDGSLSACGLYTNLLATANSLYIPQYSAQSMVGFDSINVNESQSVRSSYHKLMNQYSSAARGSHQRVLESINLGQSLNDLDYSLLDLKVRRTVEENTSKKVVPVFTPATICKMGASLRRLSWQVTGPLADRLVWLARKH